MEIMSVGRDPAGSLWAFIRNVACCSVLFQWRCLGWGGERETSPGVVACWSGWCHDRPPLSHLNRLVPGPDLINLPGAFCAPWNSSDLFPSRSMHPGGVCGGSSMRTTAPGVREPRGFCCLHVLLQTGRMAPTVLDGTEHTAAPSACRR